MIFNKTLTFLLSLSLLISSPSLFADKYRIDTEGSHASINFKIKHLGYSWLTGRFDTFKGSFIYDERKPADTQVKITVKTSSVNSNHAERDKHLRGKKFLHISKYPEAKFISTSYRKTDAKTGLLSGKFTLHGVTRPVSMNITQVGAGRDPWGGFRRGFEGKLTIKLHDYGIKHKLGSASEALELILYMEGIKDQNYLTPTDD